MYHDIAEDFRVFTLGHQPYVLAPNVFCRQAASLARFGLKALSVSEWCLSSLRPPRAVVLTFDDGHVSNCESALPILRQYGLKATFFVTAGRIGVGDTMNWSQIRSLHAAGMEIGSHTLTHRPPLTLTDEELRYELTESRRILEDGLGAPVTSISSPTGFFDKRMSQVAREVGYVGLCIGRVGLVSDATDPYALNRVVVKRTMSYKRFKKLLSFDPLTLLAMRSQQRLREIAKNTVGVSGYLEIRRAILDTISAR
jgi:peptidoglycan/xylan/chitin deacetylase (PgdA/CDA1 family)